MPWTRSGKRSRRAHLSGVLGARLASRLDVFLDGADLPSPVAGRRPGDRRGGSDRRIHRARQDAAEVARRAKRRAEPVIAVCGTIGPGAAHSYDTGIDAFTGILTGPVLLGDAIAEAPELIAGATARALRTLLIGSAPHIAPGASGEAERALHR